MLVLHLVLVTRAIYNQGRFTLWPNFERRSIWTNKMQNCPKFVLLAFTLEAEVQRMSPPKVPRWQHFQEVMAPRVRPLEPSLGRPKYSIQTSVERLKLFQRTIIFIYFSSPKASPHDIVWSRKLMLLLSTWPQCEAALSIEQDKQNWRHYI